MSAHTQPSALGDVLLVEDEDALALGLVDLLEGAGYRVTRAATGEDAIALARSRSFDAVILDVILPGRDGFDVCCELKTRSPRLAVLMLSARDASSDKVRGLRLGADDYLSKPFDTLELLARVEALFRRAALAPRTLAWTAAGIRVDVIRCEAFRDDARLDLSAREFQLLLYLLDRRGELVTREQLQRDVWGLSPDVLTRTVDIHVARLRKKVEANPAVPRLIMTVQGLGYRLLA